MEADKSVTLELMVDDIRRPKAIRLKQLLILIPWLVLIAVGSFYLVHKSHPNNQTGLNPFTSDIVQQVDYPLYYPQTLPQGFSLKPDSTSLQNGMVTFQYLHGGDGQLIITEEPMPKVIEEVTKTKQFNTTTGKAYIADLNGHTTGFILAEKTLIIISSVVNPDTDQLQEFMGSFQQAR